MSIAVAGCVAQAEGQEIIRRAPVVDVVVGPQSYHHLPQLLARAKSTAARWRPNSRSRTSSGFCPRRAAKRSARAAFPPSSPCRKAATNSAPSAWCPIRAAPRCRARSPGSSTTSLRLADHGVREITLIGQNVNAYHGEGPDGRTWPLGALLRRLADIPGIVRLRYSTSHPRDVDDTLIEAHRDLPALMPFVHLPVQSGSDRILAAMNRKHTADDYRRGHRPVSRRPPRYCIFIGFYRGLPRRDRGRFRRHPRAGHTNRIRWRLFVQIFAAAGDAGGGHAGDGVSGRDGRAIGAASGVDRQPAIGLQPGCDWQHCRCAVRTRRPQSRPDRRPHRLSATGACDGLARHHRTSIAGQDRKPRTLQPARPARAFADARHPACSPQLLK